MLGFGDEKGLMSPLADAVMTAALYMLSFRMPTLMGVFGFGSDGELSKEELERSLRILAQNSGLLGRWGISTESLALMEKVITIVPTEASRTPVEYARGIFNPTSIRNCSRNVDLDARSTVPFYMDPQVVYEKISAPARMVYRTQTIEQASATLNTAGIRTELDIERDLVGKSYEI